MELPRCRHCKNTIGIIHEDRILREHPQILLTWQKQSFEFCSVGCLNIHYILVEKHDGRFPYGTDFKKIAEEQL